MIYKSRSQEKLRLLRRIVYLKRDLGAASTSAESEYLQARIRHIDKENRRAMRRIYLTVRQAKVHELRVCWSGPKAQRSKRRAHQLSREVAGQRRGPKQRNYALMPTNQPTCSEWSTHAVKPATEGGLSGSIVSVEDVLE